MASLLKQAHRALARSAIDLPTRAALTRRLLVITNTARHDVVAASRRLEAFLGGLSRDISSLLSRDPEDDDGRRGHEEPTGEGPGPSSRNGSGHLPGRSGG